MHRRNTNLSPTLQLDVNKGIQTQVQTVWNWNSPCSRDGGGLWREQRALRDVGLWIFLNSETKGDGKSIYMWHVHSTNVFLTTCRVFGKRANYEECGFKCKWPWQRNTIAVLELNCFWEILERIDWKNENETHVRNIKLNANDKNNKQSKWKRIAITDGRVKDSA